MSGEGVYPQLSSYATKKSGFTLAEVLITLGIIGIVAVITLSSLITKIQNKGYVERLKKAQTTLQIAVNQMIIEGQSRTVDGKTIATNQGVDAAN